MTLTEKSKFLAYILRHEPKHANLTLEKEGWASVQDLVANTDLTIEDLEKIVTTDSKGRYSFNNDKSKIRANQGHSTNVDIKFKKAVPPVILYHGTSYKVIRQIQKEGLKPMSRQYVHLSSDLETAQQVAGRRKGDTVILEIDTKQMLKDGFTFFISDNGVWLVDSVPFKYVANTI